MTFKNWPPPAPMTLKRTGKPTFKKPKKPKGNGCLMSATYASLAAAEASGDKWCDGATITITGGAVFLFQESLEVSGYSGLIHKEPYGVALGTVSVSAPLTSQAEGVDPDAWAGWTDGGAGTKGVDYEYDVDAGLARFRDLTVTVGRAKQDSDLIAGAGDSELFLVVDRLTATSNATATLVNIVWFRLNAFVSASVRATIALTTRLNGVRNWEITDSAGRIGSGQDRDTEARAYLYVKDGRFALWWDDAATPAVSGTTTSTLGSSGLIADIIVGDGGVNTGLTTMKLGRMVYGNLTTA